MFRGFFLLLGNATVRQLAIGALIAVGLTVAFVIYERATANPGEMPEAWLTEQEEQELFAAIQSLSGDGAWVAGCLWDGDAKHIEDVIAVPSGNRDFYVGTSASGREMAFVVAGSGFDTTSHGSYQERGSFCLTPIGDGAS